jgi:hypothetical protein
VIVSLIRVRLAVPWSRMPPPEPLGPSEGKASPLVIVTPWIVTRNGVLAPGLATGLMSIGGWAGRTIRSLAVAKDQDGGPCPPDGTTG